jgi:hypothetical protein
MGVLRLSLAAACVVATIVTPALAQTQNALSPADQERVVCAPKRDKIGNKTGGQICMTGEQWRKALAKVRVRARQRARYTSNPGHFIADAHYFKSMSAAPVVRPATR